MSWKSAIDSLLEATVLASFTRVGYALRSRLFDWRPLTAYDLRGHTIVLTGATSGIGLAAARELAAMGATLILVARDADKAERLAHALDRVHAAGSVSFEVADLADLEQVRSACERIARRHTRIDVLIHNAGALFNERRTTADGTEASCQIMLVAPFLMTALLHEPLRAASPGRVLTMSSGGMYTAPLTVTGLEMPAADYSGVRQYARVKRAQVVLNELWANRFPSADIVFHALHPGWVDTPGISGALPGFSRLLGPLLRTPQQGADTLAWLAADPVAARSSGRFWHDRAARATHRLASTRESDAAETRAALWQWCVVRSGIDVAD
ncbi:MAG: SDR family NAD(P)-dependent oxidoreductase [Gammaproteobacteria bacterium]|nr:SDR family NAD(P)-dependent oxidoreductase [Gammaproteobacteria bacterium]